MKLVFKNLSLIICLILSLLTTNLTVKADNNYNLTPEIANAYFNIVDGLAEKQELYLLNVGRQMYPCNGYEWAFWDVRLVDFDNDKVPELFFIYDSEGVSDIWSTTNQYQVWGWNGSSAYKIASGNMEFINGIGDVDVTLRGILNENGKSYVAFLTDDGFNGSGYRIYEFYTVENGKWKYAPEKRIYGEVASDKNGYDITVNNTIGGKSVTQQQFEKRWEEVEYKIEYVWNHHDEDMYADKKFIDFANLINKPIQSKASTQTIKVDGKSFTLTAYNVGGSNYIRLRDIAAAMKTTKKPFDVLWYSPFEEFRKNVYIVTGIPYEGTISPAASKTDYVTIKKDICGFCVYDYESMNEIYENPILVCTDYSIDFRAVNINGENYVRLREIAKDIDFSVEWDSNTNVIVIDSSKGYSI